MNKKISRFKVPEGIRNLTRPYPCPLPQERGNGLAGGLKIFRNPVMRPSTLIENDGDFKIA
jgi:hypothetical protein